MYREAVITFVDILGFKNLIQKNTYEQVAQKLATVRRLSGLNETEDGEGFEPRVIQFSDSIIRIRPLDSAANKEAGYGLMFYEMLDLVHMQGELINHGICVRGGVSLGSVHVDEQILFGPGFVRAYELESIYANYPRIVVDPYLIDQVRKDPRLTSAEHTVEQDLSHIRKILRKDSDGIHFVDYLRAFLSEIDEADNIPVFLQRHKEIILQNAGGADELSSVAAKYLWMASYHNGLISEIKDESFEHYGLQRKDLEVTLEEMPLLQSLKA
ncbi:hypothetical protein [Paraburkholderia sp. Ac-20347]|uniref:hypothetical protein n=1 Tax=Paraburkholderia sp. Ac-20347 TaxID=2703892 RepID=UPI00197FEF81|nr:hypothetical protein [Paraburkholderia sp. Ac-20347]MBN3808511.1 hypothetical protein [Paraburkholderia sp. Ac-20347]